MKSVNDREVSSKMVSEQDRILKCIEELSELQRILTMKLRNDDRYSNADLIKELADVRITTAFLITCYDIEEEVCQTVSMIMRNMSVGLF